MTEEARVLDSARRAHFRAWSARVLLLLPALALLAWGRSSWDPRFSIPWTWSATGWLLPAPGLGFVWFAGGVLFWILSEIAWLLFHPLAGAKTLKPWASAGIILSLAVAVRVAIGCWWTPLPLDAAGLASHVLPAAHLWRWLVIAADLAVIVLLLLALGGAKRSLWWAALYALHPLPLIEIAGNGHWIVAAALPLIFVAAIAHRLSKALRMGLSAVTVVIGVAAVFLLIHRNPMGFNSLPVELLRAYGLNANIILPVAAAILLVLVLLIAAGRQWPLARTLAHLLVICLICSPVLQPWYVLPLLALAPLAWTRAGWVLSLSVLGAYMVVPIVRARGDFHMPDWWLALEWIPVMVLEIQELAAAAGALFRPSERRRASAGEPVPVT